MQEKKAGNINDKNDKKLTTKAKYDKKLYEYRAKIESINYRVISRLSKVSIFCACFMIIEFFGGWISGSLAIMTDAAHLLSDLSGFLISMVSLYIALRPADENLSYGYHRAEVIGALSSILIIWCLTIWLVIEAIERLYNPQHITGPLMLLISISGLGFNLIMSRILTSGNIPNAFDDGMGAATKGTKNDIVNPETELEQFDPINSIEKNNNKITNSSVNKNQKNLNAPLLNDFENSASINKISINQAEVNDSQNLIIRATTLHILGDIIQSIGVILASTIINIFQSSYPRIVLVDPICTFIFAGIVMYTSIPVTRDCINVLMEATPPDIELNKLTYEISQAEGVINLHDIHIWCISIGKPSISLHILSSTPQKTLEEVTEICNNHGIFHTTIQVEDDTQKHRLSFKRCNHLYDNTIHY